MDAVRFDRIRAIEWRGDRVRFIDQRRLPGRLCWIEAHSAVDVAAAIRAMVVRGAPAIGIAAAYGVALAVRTRVAASPRGWRREIRADFDALRGARPTAVNLGWALERMSGVLVGLAGTPAGARAEQEALRIHDEDIAANQTMGMLGAALVDSGSGVLTHCNTGALATGGYGTALGVIRATHAQSRLRQIFADETRPWLQGSRLTAWELAREGIPVTLIADGAAAYLMRTGAVQWVIVGADRIAINGDVANKIGTYGLAVAARHHGIGFMVVAPASTVDRACPDGSGIPIEQRAEVELLAVAGRRMAPRAARAFNPVFDVTPAELVDVLITERGVVRAPDRKRMLAMLDGGTRH